MRLALALLLIAAAAAAPAAAAHRRPPRGVRLFPPAQRVVTSPPPPAARISPAPPTRMALAGLSSLGDASATCRATCARSRYVCASADEDCVPQWTGCLRACAAPARP